ncbi:MAG: zinc carboxypeptidase [Micromonosporaceae bacterium]|nr:zinc carboxypeptidase [Micromonosporaceae bacterium]
MRRLTVAAGCAAVLVAGLLTGPSAVSAQQSPGKSKFEVYAGELTAKQVAKLPAAAGIDLHDTAMTRAGNDRTKIELALTPAQARKLADEGIKLSVKQVRGERASARLDDQATNEARIYRSYSEPGGIRDELETAASAYPQIAKLVNTGKSLNGQDILALKVTKNARALPDGVRPAVLYLGSQHAREWITPEMVRRLMHDVLRGYGSDSEITELVKTTELWFLPVANPDGYDFTFSEGNRLWRKNLRDNNGDGVIKPGDGVDLNRNFPTKWGYDNEGSSPNPASETYRGAKPASEPETRALDGLAKRIRFEYVINYHSAAELLLYGTGWQVSTPTPDDIVYQALAGDDEHPGVPGYDPDLSAELYTTNGETTEHLHEKYGALAFTPEMSTCQTASASDPDDAWEPQDCASIFTFPEDENLIRAEYEKNLPFALNTAKATHHPDSPNGVGGPTPDFVTDEFAVSHGESTQSVAVDARRGLEQKQLRYRINGGATKTVSVKEWTGGERYGDDGDVYFAEYRGQVRGQRPGDAVEVWFTALKPGKGPVKSASFTYRVAGDVGGEVLILATEDVTGALPAQDGDSAKYVGFYEAALTTAGYSSDVYDMDVNDRTSPHHLGVLSHYQAVVWESGDDILPRDHGQGAGTVAKSTLDTELSVRDYLNEGGKLLMTGQYNGFGQAADGVYYYNPYAPPECTARTYPCLPLFNDFQQYYLGAYTYVSDGGTDGDGNPYPVSGAGGAFEGFEGTLNGGDSADNQGHTASFLTTSSFLPPSEFPQFAGSAPVSWDRPGGAPYDPRTGEYYVASQQADRSYKRLTRTVDLSGASSGKLEFWTTYDIETDWDYLFVEARTAGQDDWTTLPDANGHTQQGTGESCTSGWVDQIHPHLAHYMGADCSPTGSTGVWHAATANSGGWQKWSIDLSAYAGTNVEVSIGYASDWGTQGIGTFLDDAAVTVDGSVVDETSFESDLGGWSVSGPPAGSPENTNDWERSVKAFEEGSGVATEDSVWLGFGIEGLATAEQRADAVRRSLKHLLG